MTSRDGRAVRTALSSWGREANAPLPGLTALTLVNAAAAAGVAVALAEGLTGRGAPAFALLAGALALRAVGGWAVARLAAGHARRVITAVRRRAVKALLLPGGDGAIGERLSTAVDEVEALDGYYGRYAPAALEARIAPFAVAVAAALASPIAAGILLATLVPFVTVLALAGGAAAAASAQQFEALARLSGRFVDRIRALPVILAFEAQARETRQVATAAEELSRRTLRVLRIAFISTAALEFFAALAVALVAVYCGFGLLGLLPFPTPESLDFRRAFVALALAPEFYAPLRRLAGAYHEKQLGEAAAARLLPIVAGADGGPTAARPLPAITAPPDVRLCNVTITLGEVTIGPVDGLAPAGRLTALVGPTGAGKSALLAAVLGLRPLQGGSLRVGDLRPGQDATSADLAAWGGQAPVFLPGTILDNLLAVRPDATPESALAMLDRVGLGPALAGRPDGAWTVLDERGSGLSGGERRRLALARALLKPAPLLVLDEPTADLDTAAEEEIIALIRAAAGDRTVLVATHSERLAAAADHVVRLP